MKNIFKSLMLVAVAAMAFTACQKDNDETNKTEQTRVVNFTATIGEDDTRSGFTEKVGNAYKSAWDGGEWIYVRANNSGASIPSISNEGKLSVSFNVNDYEADFYSPYDSWDFSTYQPKSSVLAEQTPRANSVDPKVHLLKKEDLNIEGDNIVFAMEHAIAYGKMTVNAGFEVSRVKLTLNGTEHTINGTEVENNVFWFATNEANINEFTVLAYDANGNAVTKTRSNLPAEGEGSLKFQTGRVSTFSVSNMEEYVPPVAPAFTSAEVNPVVTSNDKYIFFYDANNVLSTLRINPCGCFSGDSYDVWSEGAYSHNWSADSSVIYVGMYSDYNGVAIDAINVTVSHVDEGYHLIFEDIKDANGNMLLERATYTGTITGLSAPWATGGSEDGEEPENPDEEESDEWADAIQLSYIAYAGYKLKAGTYDSEYCKHYKMNNGGTTSLVLCAADYYFGNFDIVDAGTFAFTDPYSAGIVNEGEYKFSAWDLKVDGETIDINYSGEGTLILEKNATKRTFKFTIPATNGTTYKFILKDYEYNWGADQIVP